MPVRSRTLMSVACLASAARTAISHVGVLTWVSVVGFRSLLVRQYSYPYRSRWDRPPGLSLQASSSFYRSSNSSRSFGRANLGYGVFHPLASPHKTLFSVSPGASSLALKFLAHDLRPPPHAPPHTPGPTP